MDKTAIVWNLETEQQLMNIDSHNGEVISISFNSDGDKILTGSFDYTAKVIRTINQIINISLINFLIEGLGFL